MLLKERLIWLWSKTNKLLGEQSSSFFTPFIPDQIRFWDQSSQASAGGGTQRRVLSHQFKRAEHCTASNFNIRLIKISTLVACQSSPIWPQGLIPKCTHISHNQQEYITHTCLHIPWGGDFLNENLSESLSMEKNKQLVKYTANLLCYSSECQ